MPQVRAVVSATRLKDKYTLSSIVQGIVHSDAFLKQGPAPAPKPAGAKVGGKLIQEKNSNVYSSRNIFPAEQ
jgi:hypothetical protein